MRDKGSFVWRYVILTLGLEQEGMQSLFSLLDFLPYLPGLPIMYSEWTPGQKILGKSMFYAPDMAIHPPNLICSEIKNK